MSVETLQQVEVYRLTVRGNYRQSYDAEFVANTASDMSTNGFKIEYPITVYAEGENFVVIDGHTRREAALLGSTYDHRLDRKARLLVWVCVKDKPSDAQFKLDQLAANSKRRQPDDVSDAIGYQESLDAGATLEDIMNATGMRRDYIERRLELLKLAVDIQALVAKRQLPIMYACELARLDMNFQRIAVRYYNETKAPNLDEFRAVVNDLYTKQSQCSLFDLALFSGQPIEIIVSDLKIDRKKSREQLETELAAAIQARQADRDFARTKYQALLKKVQLLEMQLKQQPSVEPKPDLSQAEIIALIHANRTHIRAA